MNRKHANILILFAGVLFFALTILILQPKKADGEAKVSMLNIGQGDSFLITAPNGA